MVDISLSASGLFLGSESSDWHKALSGHRDEVSLLLVIFGTGFLALGRWLFLRLDGAHLSVLEFGLGFIILAGWPWVVGAF